MMILLRLFALSLLYTLVVAKDVLVLGGTGATGSKLVEMLLERGNTVRVIVRSKDRMQEKIPDLESLSGTLIVKETSVLDLTDDELKAEVEQVEFVVSCLGHNMNLKGMFGKPRMLVTRAVKRVTNLMNESQKFILMSSDGVAIPGDDTRHWADRHLLAILRFVLPPVRDNEAAAAYLQEMNSISWVAVRPTDLIDGPLSRYRLYEKPVGGLFGSGTATRTNVAKFMVDLIRDENMWIRFERKFPVLHDAPPPPQPKDEL